MELDPDKGTSAEADAERETWMGEEKKKQDIRRYSCKYCGIVRSKKALITSHILSTHQEEVAKSQVDREEERMKEEERKRCKECGVWFKKPAHLKQHMVSHSSERPFACPMEDCQLTYKRKDHLNRHVKEFHKCPDKSYGQKQQEFVCQVVGCGKTFRFASKLAAHEKSHVKLECCKVICMEQGCMKHFSNVDCLKEHMRSCHSYITCEICGKKQLKKNMECHQCTYVKETALPKIRCSLEDCEAAFCNSQEIACQGQERSVRPRRCESQRIACVLVAWIVLLVLFFACLTGISLHGD